MKSTIPHHFIPVDFSRFSFSCVTLNMYPQVCKFLEVSRLSFAREYGSKMKEGYVTVKHLREVPGSDGGRCCLPSQCLGCFGNSWAKVGSVQ